MWHHVVESHGSLVRFSQPLTPKCALLCEQHGFNGEQINGPNVYVHAKCGLYMDTHVIAVRTEVVFFLSALSLCAVEVNWSHVITVGKVLNVKPVAWWNLPRRTSRLLPPSRML